MYRNLFVDLVVVNLKFRQQVLICYRGVKNDVDFVYDCEFVEQREIFDLLEKWNEIFW